MRTFIEASQAIRGKVFLNSLASGMHPKKSVLKQRVQHFLENYIRQEKEF